MTTEHPAVSQSSTSIALTAVRAAAVLTVLSILWQGYSASNVIVAGGAALAPHEIGAVVVHVTTGLLAFCAAMRWWTNRGPVWPSVLSATTFVATFVEASLGHGPTLWAHVPLALLITMGSMAVLVQAFARASRRGSRRYDG